MVNELALPLSILFVEDDIDLLESSKRILQDMGLSVLTADTGNKAWDILITIRPGIVARKVVVTDIGLPDVNGLELIRRIRSLPILSSIPIIAISGEDPIALKNAKADGADIALQKPVEPIDLYHAIEELARNA